MKGLLTLCASLSFLMLSGLASPEHFEALAEQAVEFAVHCFYEDEEVHRHKPIHPARKP